jgi:hypothetical protein
MDWSTSRRVLTGNSGILGPLPPPGTSVNGPEDEDSPELQSMSVIGGAIARLARSRNPDTTGRAARGLLRTSQTRIPGTSSRLAGPGNREGFDAIRACGGSGGETDVDETKKHPRPAFAPTAGAISEHFIVDFGQRGVSPRNAGFHLQRELKTVNPIRHGRKSLPPGSCRTHPPDEPRPGCLFPRNPSRKIPVPVPD